MVTINTRSFGRAADGLRRGKVTRNYLENAYGSCLIECGNTRVLCAATIEDTVPSWMKGKGRGWVTAEYAMLPAATSKRTPRETNGRKGQWRGEERFVELEERIAPALRKNPHGPDGMRRERERDVQSVEAHVRASFVRPWRMRRGRGADGRNERRSSGSSARRHCSSKNACSESRASSANRTRARRSVETTPIRSRRESVEAGTPARDESSGCVQRRFCRNARTSRPSSAVTSRGPTREMEMSVFMATGIIRQNMGISN